MKDKDTDDDELHTSWLIKGANPLGNSTQVFSQLMAAERQSRHGMRAGVFLDGPKGQAAVAWALELIKEADIRFVAIHDSAPFWKAGTVKFRLPRGYHAETHTALLHTYKKAYRQRWGRMDAFQIEETRKRHPNLKHLQYLQLYGCGYRPGFVDADPDIAAAQHRINRMLTMRATTAPGVYLTKEQVIS